MKKILLLLLLLQMFRSEAQEIKIRYADVDYIFSQLPASKQIESELRSLQAQLENQAKAKYEERQKKYADYVAKEKTIEPTIRLSTQKELQLLQENLQKFEQDSQVTIQRKQEQLIDPVTKSIQQAIGTVAKENGYSFILNAGVGRQDLVLHADAAMDVSLLILQRLGVSAKPETVVKQ